MEKPKKRHLPRSTEAPRPGEIARAKGRTLNSYRVGAVPIIDRLLERMRLDHFLRSYLPRADRRCRIAPSIGVTLLLKNVLLSREPLYGIGEWAARFDPEALGFADSQLPSLNDDRVGRCLDRLFQSDITSLVLALATHVVREFKVDLDELHNDSTTITFHGAYADAAQEEKRGQKTRLAITWGYNKDHRPDLKQLLYILTVAGDGAVPLYFQVASGNVVDDKTHIATWDLLCRLVGRPDFLYVADCKLASTENMAYVHQHQGRFLTVLPRTRSEDRVFRDLLESGQIQWRHLHDKRNDKGEIVDQYSVSEPATLERRRIPAGLVPQHAQGGTGCPYAASASRAGTERTGGVAPEALIPPHALSPRSESRGGGPGNPAGRGVEQWIVTEIKERTEEKYRQDRRGRPNDQTRYVKQTSTRFELAYHIDTAQLAAETLGDGIFPLITNDGSLSGTGDVTGLQGPAVARKAILALEDRFRGRPRLSQGGQPDPGVALRLFSGALDRVATRTRAASRHGPRGDRKPASLPRRSQVSPTHGPPGDRPVRGRATSFVASRAATARGLHDTS